MNDTASSPRDPRCRYCGTRRSRANVLLKLQGERTVPPNFDPGLCPLDGHRLPPAEPDCRGCAGACLQCESPEVPLPCPRCGFAG